MFRNKAKKLVNEAAAAVSGASSAERADHAASGGGESSAQSASPPLGGDVDTTASSVASADAHIGGEGGEGSTLEHLSGMVLRTLYVCRVGSQVFFALSPIAAYLPQYLAMQETASAVSSTSAASGGGASGAGSNGSGASPRSGPAIDHQQQQHHSPSSNAISPTGGFVRGRARSSGGLARLTSTGTGLGENNGGGGLGPLPPPPLHQRRARSRSPLGLRTGNGSSPSNGNELYGSHRSGLLSPTIPTTLATGSDVSGCSNGDGHSPTNTSSSSDGGGMSPISILILLLSHLLRLVYFFGQHVWLPANTRAKSMRQMKEAGGNSAGSGVEDSLPALVAEQDGENVQYDLIVQSFVMIAIQLLLVKAMTRSRTKRHKQTLDDHDHSDATSSFSFAFAQPKQSSLSLYRGQGSSGKSSGKWGRRDLIALGLYCIRYVMAKLFFLLHPRRIWQYRTLQEHVELLALFVVTVLFYCQIWIFPIYGVEAINKIRNISVLLESCLALPQVAQNYLRKDTRGLSVVMVAGWMMGDFMKLVYFFIQSPRGASTASEAAVAAAVAGAAVPGGAGGSSTPGGATMQIFSVGCIVALLLDCFVLVQLVLHYPTPKMMSWRARVTDTWRRFKPNNATGRKRAVAREMVRLMLAGDDARNS
mmetsp:Transcript_8020/g.22376  ORF Transcript_8020/g.22376 Transcript_8020/m.22376 type:complete len:648 (-) Transcript_8020:9789-11732(-)